MGKKTKVQKLDLHCLQKAIRNHFFDFNEIEEFKAERIIKDLEIKDIEFALIHLSEMEGSLKDRLYNVYFLRNELRRHL